MNRVVLSSTMSDIYDFFLPIAAKLWRTRTGYEPLVFLVGTRKEWSVGHCNVVLKEVESAGYPVTMVPHFTGIDDGYVSMSIRQHAAALPWLDKGDILLVGDIDLLPLRRDYYHQNDFGRYSITIYHADMYEDRYWPAYGMAMSVAAWTEVMHLIPGAAVASLTKNYRQASFYDLVEAKKRDYKDSRVWTFDEEFASWKIRGSRFCNDILRVKSTRRERLCRNSWPADARAGDYIDAHCPRPGWSEESWPKIRALLAQVMPEDLPWLDGYVASYLENHRRGR